MTRPALWVPRRALVVLVALAACSGGDDATTPPSSVTTAAPETVTTVPRPTATGGPATPASTTAPTSTAALTSTIAPAITMAPVGAAMAYTDPGPYPVGVTTLTLPAGNAVEVWYPAQDAEAGEISYDVRDFIPAGVRAVLTADVPGSYSFAGGRDVTVADGRFPVVLFSHGFGGLRLQSSFLTSHLASWGMIVVAPDHPSRDLYHVLEGTATFDLAVSVGELLGSLDLITAEGQAVGGRFADHVDTDHVAAVGHSAGGGTIIGAAADDRVDGYVSMASRGPDDPTQFPVRPSFWLAGTADGIADPAATRASFEQAPAPARFWELADVGHNGFDDFCTFGNGTGIIGLAEASGLGAFLDGQPQLRALGEDGCVPPAAPVEQSFPPIRHAVTAWLRALYGVDPEPVGLGPDAAGASPIAITVESRP